MSDGLALALVLIWFLYFLLSGSMGSGEDRKAAEKIPPDGSGEGLDISPRKA